MLKSNYQGVYKSPIGPLHLVFQGEFLVEINFDHPQEILISNIKKPRSFKQVLRQLAEYFDFKRHKFNVKIAPEGTKLEKDIWSKLQTVGYGETMSYKQLGELLTPKVSPRVIGNAMAKNPIPIVIPCHRIIGSDGSLHGYGGGLFKKQYLLELERIK